MTKSQIVKSHKNFPKGFTLIEVLLVFALIAIVSTAALASYSNSSKAFTFLNSFNKVVSDIRFARYSAISSSGTTTPERYGVEISAQKVTVFIDNGLVPFKFEADKDKILEEHTSEKALVDNDYEISLSYPTPTLTFPIYLYYQPGAGDVLFYESGATGPEFRQNLKYLVLKITDGFDLVRYIMLFKVSGSPEPFSTEPSFL